MSCDLSPAHARRDDRRLARLQRAATWICAAAALGLLGLLPEPAAWTGWVGLLALLVLSPLAGRLKLQALRKAPAVLAPLGLGLALVTSIDTTAVVGGILALLLVAETASTGPTGEPRRVPLFALFAALLACTLAATPVLAPLLLIAGVAGAMALLLATLTEHEGASRSRAVTAPRQLLPLTSLLGALVAASALFFLAVPRHPGRDAQIPVPTHRLVGYAEQVRLGELMGALEDPTPIFRVKIEDDQGVPLPGPFHFRGVVLDHFDGRTWSATAATGSAPPSVDQHQAPVLQRYRFEPTAPPILVGVPRLEAISVPAEDLDLAASGTLLHRGGPRVHGYSAWSRLDPWDPTALAATTTTAPTPPSQAFLEIPEGLHPDILALADETTRGMGSDAERAAALLSLLTHGYHYERVPSAPLPDEPLAAFLLVRHTGHCELFATSLALMLRSQGIPSRVVNGFFGGIWNPVGRYWLVRHADAHAWVEAWLPRVGWVSLDPTPAPVTPDAGLGIALVDHANSQWTHGVLALDSDTQLAALAAPGAQLRRLLDRQPEAPSLEPPNRTLDLVLGLGVVVVVLLVLALAWRRLAPWLAGERRGAEPASGEVERALRAAHRLLGQRGWRPPAHLPPRAAAAWVQARAGEGASSFGTLARLHYAVRYGGSSDAQHAREARQALRELRELPSAPKGG